MKNIHSMRMVEANIDDLIQPLNIYESKKIFVQKNISKID